MSQFKESGASVRFVYLLLIVIAIGIVSGRIATVLSREGDTPFLSANDRSRWCTIAALVETGTYEIDPYLEIRGAKRNRRPWYTIDLVQHTGADGQMHYYSSKPPLLPTLYAGVYWCVSRATQLWLSDHPIYVGRIILWLVNVPTFLLFLICTIAAIDRVTTSSMAKCFLAACVCFATMLMPFAIALNNHLPAAAASSLVLFIFVRSMSRPTGDLWWLLAGLAGGFCAANELPALSMTVFWGAILILMNRRACVAYGLGVGLVALAFFATNWMAHQSLRPPYMHRGNGSVIAAMPESDPNEAAIRKLLAEQGLADATSTIELSPSRDEDRMRVLVDGHRQYGLVKSPDSTTQLRHWDDWYDYPSSYWVDGKRRGVDVGEPSRVNYLLHMTIGHYGIFSLTPIWLLFPIGLLGLLFKPDAEAVASPSDARADSDSADDSSTTSLQASESATQFPQYAQNLHRLVLAAIALATVVCGVFYVMRPEIDRNYGGVSICFRWMLWFAPLWLFACAAPVQWLVARRWGRVFLVLLLAASVFSVSTSLSGPWQPPWLYRFWSFLGWIEP